MSGSLALVPITSQRIQFEVRLAGAAGWLSAGDLDDTMIAGVSNPTGSKGEFGNDFVGALAPAKVKF